MSQSKWKIVHASVVGTSHLEKGTECQDRYAYKVINSPSNGEVLVAVLSDGAGSSDCSQFGAEMACSLFIKEIEKQISENGSLENVNKEFGLLWLDYFRQQIADFAEEQGRQVRDYACTFLAAVVCETGAIFYQVGDGGIVCSPTGETESYYFGITPATKVYANATDFITEEKVGERLLFESTEEMIEDLVMFTDGIQSIAANFQNQTPHEPFLMPMLAPIRKTETIGEDLNGKLEDFLNSSKVNEKTDDDKTLFLASRFAPIFEKQPKILADPAVEKKPTVVPSIVTTTINEEQIDSGEKEEIKHEVFSSDKVDDASNTEQNKTETSEQEMQLNSVNQ